MNKDMLYEWFMEQPEDKRKDFLFAFYFFGCKCVLDLFKKIK